jgi:hypothetical protein
METSVNPHQSSPACLPYRYDAGKGAAMDVDADKGAAMDDQKQEQVDQVTCVFWWQVRNS